MVRHIVAKGTIAQFQPGIVLICRPQGMVPIEKKGQPSPALPAYQCFLVDRISFKEPVGNRKAVGKGLSSFPKQKIKGFGQANPKIIVLLYMPVFVNGQSFLPGQAAQFKTVLVSSEFEFTPERGQLHIPIGDSSLILKHDIDFMQPVSDRRQGRLLQFLDDCCHFLRLFFHALGKQNACGIRIDLFPFQRRRNTSKQLGICLKNPKHEYKKQGYARGLHGWLN